jgi:hypothetical protein
MTDPDALAVLQQSADQLAETMKREDSLTPAFQAIESELQRVRDSGLPMQSLLPPGERMLGFARKAKSGESFWDVYAGIIRKKLCAKNSKLRKLADSGVTLSAGAIVAVLATALALPVVAVGLISPMAALIARLGIDAFCEYSKPSHGSRRAS